MGYYTHLSGELLIEPPLNWEEFKDSKYLTSDGWPLGIQVESETIETALGTLERKTGLAVLIPEDAIKTYTFDETLQELVDAFPGHRFVGVIHGEGEENNDMWRMYVRHGLVIKAVAKVVWPDPPSDDD